MKRINVTPNKFRRDFQSLASGLVRQDMLPAEELANMIEMFQAWAPDQDVAAGDIRHHNGELYEAYSNHTTQANWPPDTAVSLWRSKIVPGTIPVWVQPTGAHDAYFLGSHVIHPEGGPVWKSNIDANTTEPGTLVEHNYWEQVEI